MKKLQTLNIIKDLSHVESFTLLRLKALVKNLPEGLDVTVKEIYLIIRLSDAIRKGLKNIIARN